MRSDLGRCGPCRGGAHGHDLASPACTCWCSRAGRGRSKPAGALADRVAGGLWGLCAGDALGATCEFMTPAEIAGRIGDHRDITGGGLFGWAPGQGTDDSDLAMALARAYVEGYSLERVAAGFVAWYRSGPRDVGSTTAGALRALADGADPRRSGLRDDRSAANGGLMRAVATGLVRSDAAARRQEAAEVSAITHAERRCVQAAIAYCDLVSHLVDGATPEQSLAWVLAESGLDADVADVVRRAPDSEPADLDTSGYVLGTLGVAIWALCSGLSLEDALVQVVNLGGDADTTGAVAGGLLGAHHGASTIPPRWVQVLAYGPELADLTPRLATLRSASAGATG